MKKLSGPLADFALAWQLLTAVPLPAPPSTRPAGWAAPYYPLVGLLVGGLLALSGELFYRLLPGNVAAVLVLGLWVALTGMLHLDGFMDACDGLLPPRDRARRLEIMKDSRVGAFGVVGGVLLLLLKFNALAALPATARWQLLLVTPLLARWALLFSMWRYPLARPDGMATFFTQGLSWRRVAVVSVGVLAVSAALLGLVGVALMLVAWLALVLVAHLALARIGGLTGDVYGALCETAEAALLVAAVGLASGGLL